MYKTIEALDTPPPHILDIDDIGKIMHISECLLWINRKYVISILFQKIIPAIDFIIDQYLYSIQLYMWAYVHFSVVMYFSTLLRTFYVVVGHVCILVLLHTFCNHDVPLGVMTYFIDVMTYFWCHILLGTFHFTLVRWKI